MKNLLLLLFLSFIYGSVLVAQQGDAAKGEQIIFLDNGVVLIGKLEEVNEKVVRISKDDDSFTVKKKTIVQVVPADVSSDAEAQNSEALVILKNKDWSIAEVQVVSTDFVLLKTDGLSSKIQRSQIFKIYPLGQTSEQSVEYLQNSDEYTMLDVASLSSQYDVERKGKIYNISSLLVMPRLVLSRDGAGIQHTAGYRINPYFGLGITLGVTKYDNDFPSIFAGNSGVCLDFCSFSQDVTSVSFGLSVTRELNQRKIRPYYNIDIGFTKTIRSSRLNEFISLVESDNIYKFDSKSSRPSLGSILQPSFGVQIQAKSLTFLVDIGFQFADVNYEYESRVITDNQAFILDTTKEEIRGFILKVGIML